MRLIEELQEQERAIAEPTLSETTLPQLTDMMRERAAQGAGFIFVGYGTAYIQKRISEWAEGEGITHSEVSTGLSTSILLEWGSPPGPINRQDAFVNKEGELEVSDK